MTANAARLGLRQIDVLRAAAAGELVRYSDGGWAAGTKACTPAARPLADRQPALFVEGDRMAIVTGGSWGARPGVYMLLSAEGERVLAEVDRLRPELLEEIQRRTILVRELAGLPKLDSQALVDGLLSAAANDAGVDDATFPVLAQAAERRDIELNPTTDKE